MSSRLWSLLAARMHTLDADGVPLGPHLARLAPDTAAWHTGPPSSIAARRLLLATHHALTTPLDQPLPTGPRVSTTAARSRSTTTVPDTAAPKQPAPTAPPPPPNPHTAGTPPPHPARDADGSPRPARSQRPHPRGLLWHRARDPGDDARVINRELSSRLAAGHGRRVTQLADAATRWGGHVPEDPGITELTDLLETAAIHAPDHPGGSGHTPSALLAGAVEDLRAAARLGGLLPAVTLWHLQRAIDQEHTTHQQNTATAQRQGHRR